MRERLETYYCNIFKKIVYLLFISAWCWLILYVVGYILGMTPCESFLLANNGSSKLEQLAVITFSFLEYIYILPWMLWIYSLNILEKTDENQLYVCSPTTSILPKVSTLFRALWWHQLFSARWPEQHWWVLGRTKHVSADIA